MKPGISTIAHFTAAVCGIREEHLRATRRDAPTVRARWIAMYLAREMTGRSFPEIGRMFGDRDHTTVMHACRRMAERVQREPELAVLVDSIRRGLQAPAEAA